VSRSHILVRRATAVIVLVALAAVSFAVGAKYATDDDGGGGGGADNVAKAPGPPATQTVKKSMWGNLTLDDGTPLFPVYRDLGVGLFSTAVRWDDVAPDERPKNPTDPSDPAYTWPSYLQVAIDEATKNNMEVQVLVLGTPKWANGGKDWPWVPNDPKDYGDFMQAISRKYPSVGDWMIWGEPNREPNFKPFTPVEEGQETAPLNKAQQVAPRNYAELVDAAYEGIKSVEPDDNVIAGNTYTSAGVDDINPYQWIENLKLRDGSRPRMDMWGHNPFGFAKPDLDDPPSRKGVVAFADLRRLTAVLDENFPGPPLKLFLAEWGVPEGFKDKDIGYVRSPEEADEWIRAGFKIANEWDRIYSLGWIHPVNTDRSSMGLLTVEGKKKPTYDSYKNSLYDGGKSAKKGR